MWDCLCNEYHIPLNPISKLESVTFDDFKKIDFDPVKQKALVAEMTDEAKFRESLMTD